MARRSNPHRLPVTPTRTGSARDRRGRGVRGPLALPGPLSERAPTLGRDRATEFDELVLSLVERLSVRWGAELRDVVFGTEDVPQIPDNWVDEPVPLGSLVRGATSSEPARIVLFRRPIELRAVTRLERAALVNEVLVEHIADLLGREPEDIDPS